MRFAKITDLESKTIAAFHRYASVLTAMHTFRQGTSMNFTRPGAVTTLLML
jgi:hypothetical protein